jgi:hypothetical protein
VNRGKAFLALILAQACHSVEEYFTRLYDRFPPARLVSDLFGLPRPLGFIAFNVSLVAFGLLCYAGPVRRGSRGALPLAWFWVVLETLNACGHVAWAVSAGGYRPGLATAPLLFIAALFLGWRLSRSPSETCSADSDADKLSGRSVSR